MKDTFDIGSQDPVKAKSTIFNDSNSAGMPRSEKFTADCQILVSEMKLTTAPSG